MFPRCVWFGLALWASAGVCSASIVDSEFFINELHYDNTGTDRQELVEIAVPDDWAATSQITLTLYNGGDGAPYGGPFGLERFVRGERIGRFVFYVLEIALQNGAPDGLALATRDGVQQFLSYEGSFTARGGVADGLQSTDIGVFEPTGSPLGWSLQLSGRGNSYADFQWQPAQPATGGLLNLDQFFEDPPPPPEAVPEPSSRIAWTCLALITAAATAASQRAGRRQPAPVPCPVARR